MFNNTVHVLDEKLEHVGHGEVGQIFVSGRNVVSDYLTDEHEGSFVVLNSETHKEDRLYKTGDWGLIQNGRLVYQGAIKSEPYCLGLDTLNLVADCCSENDRFRQNPIRSFSRERFERIFPECARVGVSGPFVQMGSRS